MQRLNPDVNKLRKARLLFCVDLESPEWLLFKLRVQTSSKQCSHYPHPAMSTAVPLAAATVKALEGDWQYVDKKVECGVDII